MSAAIVYTLVGFALGSVGTLIVLLLLLSANKLEIVSVDDRDEQ